MKFLRLSFWFYFAGLQRLFGQDPSEIYNKAVIENPVYINELYNTLFREENKPAYHAFSLGYDGMKRVVEEGKLKNDTILTIIDYSKPSNERRLWVIDVKNEKILHNALVAHGKNSGVSVPTQFSNIPHSNMSSQGFFVTGETYYGKHGYSLRIDGIEPGINDKARTRAIVIHSAEYVTMYFVSRNGRLGRSFGCPALPPAKSEQIINTIKDKSCLFIYAPDKQYALNSKLIKLRAKS